MILGVDFLLTNQRNAHMKESIVISGIISRYTAIVLGHVNKQMYASPMEQFLHLIFKVSEKSTLVTVNGGPLCTLSFGNGGASGT